ncbi:MAG: hypothetical protein U0Q11_18540 [Vicinamibacterales bacterium]
MRLFASALFLAVLTGACTQAPPPPSPEFRPTATVKDIMDSVIDPGSDALWDLVEIIATLEGTVHKQPKSDDDWKTLRRAAVSVVEASNPLPIPGRQVARPGELRMRESI